MNADDPEAGDGADLPGIWRVRYRGDRETRWRRAASTTPKWSTSSSVPAAAGSSSRAARSSRSRSAIVERQLWALFVDPPAQGQGHGAALHTRWSTGCSPRPRTRSGCGTATRRAPRVLREHGWRAGRPHERRESATSSRGREAACRLGTVERDRRAQRHGGSQCAFLPPFAACPPQSRVDHLDRRRAGEGAATRVTAARRTRSGSVGRYRDLLRHRALRPRRRPGRGRCRPAPRCASRDRPARGRARRRSAARRLATSSPVYARHRRGPLAPAASRACVSDGGIACRASGRRGPS